MAKITDYFSHPTSKKARQDDSLPSSSDLLSSEGPVFMDLSESEAESTNADACARARRLCLLSRTTSGSEVESTDSLYPQSTSSSQRTCSSNETDSQSSDSFHRGSYTRRGKHKLGYDPVWEKEFTWLEYSVESSRNPGMLCRLCRKYNVTARNKSGNWVSQPCLQMRKDKVVRHSQSDMHLAALEKERLAIAAAADGGIAQAFEKTVTLQTQALSGSMQILYWLAKNEVAHFTKFESLRELCFDLGCDYFRELNVGGNAHYSSHRIIDEWLEVLSDIIEEDVLATVHKSPAIGLMCDESTDISVTKELILYARILSCGEAQAHFLKLIYIHDGKAETIENTILAYLEEAGIPLSTITGFGSDGANVMVGSINGVATRLKRLNPQLLSIHCINHRLALGTSQAATSVPYLLCFEEIVTSIYKFYHYSATRQSGLAEIQSVLGDPLLKFKEPKAVRWLSHALAINALKRSLPSLLCSLEREASERSDPTALGLAKLCKTYMFVATLMLMSDVLFHVTRLSLLFQKEKIDFAQVQSLVQSCIEAVRQLESKPGPAMKSTDTVIQSLTEDHQIQIAGITDENKAKFQKDIQQKYCFELCQHLEKRFPDLPMIKAFQVFNPQMLPTESDHLEGYGEDYITELSHHYHVDTCTALQEWASLRLIMQQEHYRTDKDTTDVLRVLAMDDTFKTLYPLLSKFAQIALALPVSNADSERGFSCMNRVKNSLAESSNCVILGHTSTDFNRRSRTCKV